MWREHGVEVWEKKGFGFVRVWFRYCVGECRVGGGEGGGGGVGGHEILR